MSIIPILGKGYPMMEAPPYTWQPSHCWTELRHSKGKLYRPGYFQLSWAHDIYGVKCMRHILTSMRLEAHVGGIEWQGAPQHAECGVEAHNTHKPFEAHPCRTPLHRCAAQGVCDLPQGAVHEPHKIWRFSQGVHVLCL